MIKKQNQKDLLKKYRMSNEEVGKVLSNIQQMRGLKPRRYLSSDPATQELPVIEVRSCNKKKETAKLLRTNLDENYSIEEVKLNHLVGGKPTTRADKIVTVILSRATKKLCLLKTC